jgi:hypothetical protein
LDSTYQVRFVDGVKSRVLAELFCLSFYQLFWRLRNSRHTTRALASVLSFFVHFIDLSHCQIFSDMLHGYQLAWLPVEPAVQLTILEASGR